MLEPALGHSWAQAAGLVGLAGRVAWPLLGTRQQILSVQALISVAFTTHFALLGIATATLVSLLSTAQALAMLTPLQRIGPRLIAAAAILGMIGIMALSWDGLALLLVTCGLGMIAAARACADARRMARLLTAGQVVMLAHDIAIGSPIAILADLCGLIIRAVTGLDHARPVRLPSGARKLLGSRWAGVAQVPATRRRPYVP